MKYITKLKLAAVHQLCDAEDKSTEYMFQYMQDVCNVNLDCVLSYMKSEHKEELFKEVNDFLDLFITIDEQT